jgi:hypothetical protein
VQAADDQEYDEFNASLGLSQLNNTDTNTRTGIHSNSSFSEQVTHSSSSNSHSNVVAGNSTATASGSSSRRASAADVLLEGLLRDAIGTSVLSLISQFLTAVPAAVFANDRVLTSVTKVQVSGAHICLFVHCTTTECRNMLRSLGDC